jgi:hypothetical protein
MRAAKRVRVELRKRGIALPRGRACGLPEMHEAMCRAYARERWACAEKERASARMRARKELLQARAAP